MRKATYPKVVPCDRKSYTTYRENRHFTIIAARHAKVFTKLAAIQTMIKCGGNRNGQVTKTIHKGILAAYFLRPAGSLLQRP